MTDLTSIEKTADGALAEARTISAGGHGLVAAAQAFILEPDNDVLYTLAGQRRAELKTAEQNVISRFRPPKHRMDEAKAALVALEKEALAPIKTALAIYEGKIMVEKRRRDAVAEEARKAALEAARKAEEDRRLREAEAAFHDGAITEEEALAALDEPLEPILAPAPPVAPKFDGTSFKAYWSAEVYDMVALVVFAARNPTLIPSLLLPNQPDLNGMARARKEAMSIPGVRPIKTEKMAGGAR